VPDLPTVEQSFEASVLPFVEAMGVLAESVEVAGEAVDGLIGKVGLLQVAIDSLHGRDIGIGVDVPGLAAADAEVASMGAGFDAVRRDIADMSADMMVASAVLREMNESVEAIKVNTADASLDLMAQTAILAEMRDLWAENAAMAGVYNISIREAGTGASSAGNGFRILGTGIRLSGTAIHWLIAGTAEYLAVAIPGTIALGAALADAGQGAQMAYLHMTALYTATEATANIFHETFGQALGLRAALQEAQNAANPMVYAILGSALDDLKARFSGLAQAGLQVVSVMDEFAARVTVDLQGSLGREAQGLLSQMVTDLVEFGQILGNVGHAILNLAGDMPGLAHVLLAVADGISRVILAITSLPSWIITTFMAFEEFYRWGGLALRMVTALAAAPAAMVTWFQGANFIRAFGQSIIGLVNYGGLFLQWAGQMVARLEGVIPAAAEAGEAMTVLGEDMSLAAVTMRPMLVAGVAGAVAALVGLVFVLSRVQDATQKWVSSSQEAVRAASDLDVYNVISQRMADNSIRMAAAQQALTDATAHTAPVMGAASRYTSGYSAAADQAAQDVQALTRNQQFLSSTAAHVTENATALGAALRMTSGEALLMASAAGVNLQQSMGKNSEAFKIARQEVLNLGEGYRAMGMQSGVVGQDMAAVAFQAGLQTTKVAQLTQAWDAYMGLLTGGTSGLATFEQGLQNMGSVASSTSGTLFTAAGTMNQATNSFAAHLEQFTGKGAQDWQNFNQVISTGAQQFIDWMNNAAAVGDVTAPQFTSAIKGIVNQMIPFATHSGAARSELAGLAQEADYTGGTSLKSLEQWARQSGMSAKQLGDFVDGTTGKLSDLAQVAANLGTVLQSQLATAFDEARLKTSGFDSDLAALSNEIGSHASPASAGYKSALDGLIGSMAQMHVTVPVITAFIRSLGVNISQAGVNAVISRGSLNAFSSSAGHAGGLMAAAAAAAYALANNIRNIPDSKTVTITTAFVSVGGPPSAYYHGQAGHAVAAGYQSGGDVAHSGYHLVGEQGPEIRWLNAGDHISDAAETRQILSPATGGPTSLDATIHTHVYMDGHEVWTGQQQETLIYNRRNGNQQAGVVSPSVSQARS
jgi:hypothetical protein